MLEKAKYRRVHSRRRHEGGDRQRPKRPERKRAACGGVNRVPREALGPAGRWRTWPHRGTRGPAGVPAGGGRGLRTFENRQSPWAAPLKTAVKRGSGGSRTQRGVRCRRQQRAETWADTPAVTNTATSHLRGQDRKGVSQEGTCSPAWPQGDRTLSAGSARCS